MKKCIFVVLTNAIEDREAEYNEWYSGKHLRDVVAVPGVRSAQRFRLIGEPVQAEPLYKYFASYEIESDDPEATLADLMSRVGTDQMPLTEGLDSKLYCAMYEVITDCVVERRDEQ